MPGLKPGPSTRAQVMAKAFKALAERPGFSRGI